MNRERSFMSIRHAILGFLSWTPLTGYDLKKLFADSEVLYWSGNNHQIYRALVELHDENLVTRDIQQQENRPARKIYSITEKGLAELRDWLHSTPELPQLRDPFLIQLAWADQLSAGELETLLGTYEEELALKLLMLSAENQRHDVSPRRTPRETYLWGMITENQVAHYEQELAWVRKLRKELRETPTTKETMP
jgi:PadR family transcriptional regulator AphA